MATLVASMLPLPDELIELPEDVVGLQLLRLVNDHGQGHLLSRAAVGNPSYWETEFGVAGGRDAFVRAMTEAWDWLFVERLIAMKPGESTFSGHAFITRRGFRVLAATDAPGLVRAENRIGVELHPEIANGVRSQFLLGNYDFAALTALKAVEIRVRDLANAGPGDIGVRLMRDAFRPDVGSLTDPDQEKGEQQATADLFAGAIGVFKNPSSHREVHYDDPVYAAEVVMLGDLLLRMLDRIGARLRAPAEKQ